MRSSRIIPLMTILTAVLLTPFSIGLTSSQPNTNELTDEKLIASYHGNEPTAGPDRDDQTPGIREDVPVKYRSRYEQWKEEFLSTEAGRNQWSSYQNNPNFSLHITVARDNAEGATTGKYKWNDAGQLVSATITLGVRIDEGYPNPIYFPVMNSLVPEESAIRIGGNTLAATKIAHEFGHVNRTLKTDAAIYQLQTQLIPQYNTIFLSNGRNPKDPRLTELAMRIGGTPVQIWEDREYWGEANAMMYLRDRVTDEGMRCSLFSKIRHSVDLYAKDYEPRFLEIVRANPTRKVCGWQ
jgi:YD repeat-containing protein